MDIERVLMAAITDVIGDEAETHVERLGRFDYRVQLRSRDGSERLFGIRASYEWFTAFVPDLDVSVTLFEYDDEEEKAAAIRELACVALTYLRGRGTVERKRGPFRQRTTLTIEVNDRIWKLGPHTASHSYP